MLLGVIIITLIVDRLLVSRFRPDWQSRRDPVWLDRWLRRRENRGLWPWLGRGTRLFLTLTLPVLGGVFALDWLLGDHLWGLPAALLAGVVLWFCLGHQDLGVQIHRLTRSRETADQAGFTAAAKEILEVGQLPLEPELSQRLLQRLLEETHRRTFAVLFWLLVLGPAGALAYRLVFVLRRYAILPTVRDYRFANATYVGLSLLDWAPVRVQVLGFCFTGSFDEALRAWRNWPGPDKEALSQSTGLLACVGQGALRSEERLAARDVSGLSALPLFEASRLLMWRSLWLWGGITLLFIW